MVHPGRRFSSKRQFDSEMTCAQQSWVRSYTRCVSDGDITFA